MRLPQNRHRWLRHARFGGYDTDAINKYVVSLLGEDFYLRQSPIDLIWEYASLAVWRKQSEAARPQRDD